MDERKTTLLMKFEADGGPIKAECPLVIDSGDTLATKLVVMQAARLDVPGFRIVTPGQLPRYFLLSAFSFSASLSDSETQETPRKPATNKPKGEKPDDDTDAQFQPAPSFALWRSATDDSKKAPSKKPNNSPDQTYLSHIDSFSFTRLIDCATTTLVKACCDGTSFKSASIIKRKPARSSVKSDPVDTSFIRIDFAGVKITGLNYSDGDVVTETCTFTCDSLQIIYAQQDPSGKLTPLSPISWQNPMSDAKNRGAGG